MVVDIHECTKAVPKTNIETYKYIYLLEVALRELFIEEFESLSGPRWYKDHLPEDMLDKYKDARRKELEVPWESHVPLHPIYYTDFGELIKAIKRKDNWKASFRNIFGKRKDIPIADLDSLLNIRNKIAHHRIATDADLKKVESVFHSLASALGERLNSLVSKPTMEDSIETKLRSLRKEMTNTLDSCLQMEKTSEIPLWAEILNSWWFDESYLNHDLEPIEVFNNLMLEYCELPRTRGAGPVIERWVKQNDPKSTFENATICLDDILKGC